MMVFLYRTVQIPIYRTDTQSYNTVGAIIDRPLLRDVFQRAINDRPYDISTRPYDKLEFEKPGHYPGFGYFLNLISWSSAY